MKFRNLDLNLLPVTFCVLAARIYLVISSGRAVQTPDRPR